jgi:predicted  nucleic acid-binding Zn-ribbon protein
MALKASPDDQALLLDLQALDTKLQQADHRAKGLPEHAVLADLAKQSETIRATFAEQSGALEDVKIELSRVESDVQVVLARIARDTERLQGSSSVKDVAAFEQEITALKKRQNDLEEIELTVMEKLDEAEKAVAATRSELDGLQAQVAEAEGSRDAALVTIEADRTNATANRRTIESKVPAELLALYEKQRARYGAGASHLRGGVSTASGVKLNSHDMQLVRAAALDDVLLCPESSAILVRTAESGL